MDRAAERRGMVAGQLARTQWSSKRFARLRRMVAREGEGHRAPVKDLARIALETGVALAGVYDRKTLNVALAHRRETVRVGERGFDLTIDIPKPASVLWALGEPEISGPLQEAFRASVRETLADLERWTSYGMRGRHGEGQSARRVETSGFLGWGAGNGRVMGRKSGLSAQVTDCAHCPAARWIPVRAPGDKTGAACADAS